ncbi:Hsp70 family protein [Nocardia cyriacigeorgica]|uniref:Hsp70 family protein n=1 Tax=Nocardia cyriacigeorgica TaxID=135487 RepID=UPI002491A151|nr:Hsp70 family protein [Nocardia cyriacigeorgica]
MNSVSAVATAEQPRPTVRTRRTTAAFDGSSGVRVGAIPEFAGAVTDFADLARDPDSVTIGGRIWSPANMIAAVVHGLLASAEPCAGVVTTYPAVYSNKQVALLRQALELSGVGHVELVPEPVAAAEWLEREHGPLPSEFVLVYDLGGNSLDITVVRMGPDWPDHPMVGKPVRCYDFGGRPLGAMIARYAGGKGKTAGSIALTSIVDTDGLRVEQIRDSLEVVRAAVRAAGISMSDIGRILVVGGAARPPEVARTLAELGKPVIMSADPGQTVAAGAAYLAARTATPAAPGASFHPPVFSGAAIFSAIAMSAATMFGSGTVDTQLSPVLDRFPRLDMPHDALLVELDGSALSGHGLAGYLGAAGYAASGVVRAASAMPARLTGYAGMVSPSAYARPQGPTMAESRGETRIDSHSDHRQWRHRTDELAGTYADPARFRNPMPFGRPDRTVRPPSDPVEGAPSVPGGIPGVGDGSSPVPGTPGSVPGGTTGPDPSAPGGTTPGTPVDSTVPGGTAPGGSTGGIPANDPSTGGIGVPGGSAGAGSDGSGGGVGDGSSTGTGAGAPGGTVGGDSSGGAAGGATGGGSGGATGGASGGATGGSGGASSGASDGSTGGSSGAGTGGSTSGGAGSDGSASGGSTSGGSASGGSGSGGSTSGGSASGGSTSGGSASGGSTSGGSTGGSTSGGSSAGGSSSGGSSSGGSTSGGSSSGGSSGRSTSGGSRGSSSGDSDGSSSGGSRSGGSRSSSGGDSDGGSSSGGSRSGGSKGGSGGSRGGSGGSGGSGGGSGGR